jgi:hypothetical protein
MSCPGGWSVADSRWCPGWRAEQNHVEIEVRYQEDEELNCFACGSAVFMASPVSRLRKDCTISQKQSLNNLGILHRRAVSRFS